MRHSWYDRQGNSVNNMEWIESKLRDINYKRIAETTLSDGKWISTVWLVLNHAFGDEPPLIFETMVFKSKYNMNEIDMARYSTENGAIIGHQKMVEKYEPTISKT